MHLAQCLFQIAAQNVKWPVHRRAPANQHIIISRLCQAWQQQICHRAQPPFNTISHDCISYFTGNCKSDAGKALFPLRVSTRACLQDQPLGLCLAAARHAQKIRPALQTRQSCTRLRGQFNRISIGRHASGPADRNCYADRRLRPRARRRLMTRRPALVAIRERKPWRRFRTSRLG